MLLVKPTIVLMKKISKKASAEDVKGAELNDPNDDLMISFEEMRPEVLEEEEEEVDQNHQEVIDGSLHANPDTSEMKNTLNQ